MRGWIDELDGWIGTNLKKYFNCDQWQMHSRLNIKVYWRQFKKNVLKLENNATGHRKNTKINSMKNKKQWLH